MTGIALHQFDEVGVSEKIFDSMESINRDARFRRRLHPG
jgi:hypothetical protein